MSVCVQAAVQAFPVTMFATPSCVQFLLSLQLATVGQAPVAVLGRAVSQVSAGDVTMPSPQQGVKATLVHFAVHALPVNVSVVQALPSLQSAATGHLPGPLVIAVSQVSGLLGSPGSHTPLPQLAAQSLSVLLLAPVGQQPSPETVLVIGACTHLALQVPAD
jgi:hypothetical protein